MRRQYMEGGDLDKALTRDIEEHGAADRRLGWYRQGRRVMRDVARAMKHLHSLWPSPVRSAGRMPPACIQAGALPAA